MDREAYERVKVLVMQMAEKQGVTEQLKAEQPMLWVRKMNGIGTAAEKMVKPVRLIYVNKIAGRLKKVVLK